MKSQRVAAPSIEMAGILQYACALPGATAAPASIESNRMNRSKQSPRFLYRSMHGIHDRSIITFAIELQHFLTSKSIQEPRRVRCASKLIPQERRFHSFFECAVSRFAVAAVAVIQSLLLVVAVVVVAVLSRPLAPSYS